MLKYCHFLDYTFQRAKTRTKLNNIEAVFCHYSGTSEKLQNNSKHLYSRLDFGMEK